MALTKAPEELLDKSLTSALTITTADNNAQLILVSTDADASTGPQLDLTRSSASPAASDTLGRLRFVGKDSAGNDLSYGHMTYFIEDPTDGAEDGIFEIDVRSAGTNRSRLKMDSSETIFNNEHVDIDFRVESDSNSHMLFVDASTDRVGSGTDSPDRNFHIETAGDTYLRVSGNRGNSNDLHIGNIEFENTNGSNGVIAEMRAITGSSGTQNTKGQLTFHTDDGSAYAERMRIDSSGNLFVSKTSSSVDTDGVELLDTGFVRATVDGDTVLQLNRRTSDGTIVNLRKNGGSVAVIGVDAGDNTYIGGTASGHGGFYFGNTNVAPMAAGTRADNTVDLGTSTYRWKDLYLSGGLHVGGTGSANALSDYEEGAWSPTLSSTGTASFSGAKYTKVGRLVTCNFYVINISNTTSSTAFSVSLPFTAASNDKAAPVGFMGVDIDIGEITSGYIGSTTTAQFYKVSSSTAYQILKHSNFGANTAFYVAFTYMAAS